MEPKGGISPIVALTLLFVVAVVSVVGLQSWYQSYSSDLFANVDEETMNRAMIQVDGVYGGTLYIRQQQGDDNTSLKTVKVNNEDCQINDSLKNGVNRLDVSSCLENVSGSRADISLITNSGVVTHTISLDGKISASNSSVTSLSCPTGFVEVPGDGTFSTNDFCVMQYEAKENGGAVSEPTGQPWVNISLSEARTACSNLGSDYHLMTNAEWMSMARNLEQRTGNWYGGMGSGFLYIGHSDEAPNVSLNASSTSDAFYRTGDQSDSCDSGTSWSSKGATQLNTSLSQVFSHNDDLLGMYLLNGTGEEMTNRGVDGTSYGGVTADTDRLGISGGASRFDGDDTYIDISGKALNITSDITL